MTPTSSCDRFEDRRVRRVGEGGSVGKFLLDMELEERVGRKAGAYRLHFGASHGVEIADALIAAAAHVHGLTRCTRNLRHYPMRDIKKRRV
jgi:predicted nucleic acid-binding protein